MSYVAMAKNVCEVCGKLFDSGEILLDRRLRDIPEDKAITGFGLCDEHQKLHAEGFIALVEADTEKSTPLPNGNLNHQGAHRTGRLMHMKRHVADDLFNTELPSELAMVYIDEMAFDQIMGMMPEKEVHRYVVAVQEIQRSIQESGCQQILARKDLQACHDTEAG